MWTVEFAESKIARATHCETTVVGNVDEIIGRLLRNIIEDVQSGGNGPSEPDLWRWRIERGDKTDESWS